MPAQIVAPRRVVGIIPRRPAVPTAAMLILGICAHAALTHTPLLWCLIAVGSVLAAIVGFHFARCSTLFLFAGIFFAAAAIAQIESFQYPANHIGAYATDSPRLAQLEVEIDHEPRVLTDPFGQHPMPPKQIM